MKKVLNKLESQSKEPFPRTRTQLQKIAAEFAENNPHSWRKDVKAYVKEVGGFDYDDVRAVIRHVRKNRDNGDVPVITKMVKLDSRPPTWYVSVEGIDKSIPCTTDQLFSFNKFKERCLDEGNKSFPPLTKKEWFEIVSPAMDKVIVEAAPPEATTEGQFAERLATYVTEYKADSQDQMLIGWVWKADGRYHFLLTPFVRYLKRVDMRDERGKLLRHRRVTQLLRNVGGTWKLSRMKGKTETVWSVPEIPDLCE